MRRMVTILLSLTILSWFLMDRVESAPSAPTPTLTKEEFDKANWEYLKRCGGCHGMLRKGATGLPLLPDKMKQKGTDVLKKIICNGTPGGMPGWGAVGVYNEETCEPLEKYIQMDPVQPPEFNMSDIKKTWKLYVPPDKRPTKPMHKRNWENFFAVILRDAGSTPLSFLCHISCKTPPPLWLDPDRVIPSTSLTQKEEDPLKQETGQHTPQQVPLKEGDQIYSVCPERRDCLPGGPQETPYLSPSDRPLREDDRY